MPQLASTCCMQELVNTIEEECGHQIVVACSYWAMHNQHTTRRYPHWTQQVSIFPTEIYPRTLNAYLDHAGPPYIRVVTSQRPKAVIRGEVSTSAQHSLVAERSWQMPHVKVTTDVSTLDYSQPVCTQITSCLVDNERPLILASE